MEPWNKRGKKAEMIKMYIIDNPLKLNHKNIIFTFSALSMGRYEWTCLSFSRAHLLNTAEKHFLRTYSL